MGTRLLFICLLASAFAVSVKGKPHVKHQASFKSSHTTTEKVTQHAVSEGANKDQVLHTNIEASSLEQEDEELSSQDNVDKEEEREEGDEDGKRSTPVLLSEEELVNLLQESREEVKEEVKEEVEEEVEEEEGKVEVESAETVEEVPAKHEAEVEGEMAEEGEDEEGVDVKEGEVMREKEEETEKRAQEEAEDSEEEEEDSEEEEEAADKQNDKKEESLAVDGEEEADVKDIGSSTETEIPSDMDYTMPLETQTPAGKTPADETLPLLEEKELDEAKSLEQKEEEAEGEIPTAVNDYESQQDVKNTESLEDKELSDQGKPQEVNQNSGQDSQAKPQENSSTREEDKPEVDQGSNNSMELDGSMEEDKKKESISHPKGKIRKMKKNLRVRKHHAQRDEASHDTQRDEASHDSQRDEASHDSLKDETSHDSQKDEAHAGQTSQDSQMDEVHAGKASQDSKMDEVHAGKASQDSKMDEAHAGQASQDSQMDEAPAGQASQDSKMDEVHAGKASQDSKMDEVHAGKASQDSQMDEALAGQASQDSQRDEAPAGKASQDSQRDEAHAGQASQDSQRDEAQAGQASQDSQMDEAPTGQHHQDSQMDEAPAGQHHQDSEKSEGQVEPSLPTDNAFHKPQRKRAGKWAPSVGMNPVQVRARVDLYPRTRPLLWTSNHRGEASTDPCDTFHCKRGKTCMLDKDNKPTCVCQQPSACPHSKSEIDHVCGSDNVTYDTSCELFATKCNLEGTRRGHKLHLDYTGPCKLIAPCLSLELVQFPLRMRDWLKNVLLQLYEHDSKTPGFLTSKQRIRVRKIFESERRLHAGDHPIELLAQDFEKNYNMYIYPVHWQFAQMDQHPADRLLTHSELAPLRVPLVPMEHCTSLFFQECDVDKDKKVSFREWAHCFGIKNEDMDVNLLF